jgi:hypothetical protein
MALEVADGGRIWLPVPISLLLLSAMPAVPFSVQSHDSQEQTTRRCVRLTQDLLPCGFELSIRLMQEPTLKGRVSGARCRGSTKSLLGRGAR